MSFQMIKIEKGIPLPPPANNGGAGGRPPVYPWRQMAVGDSFVANHVRRNSVHRSARDWAKKTGFKFTTRKIGEGQYRVWRIG